MPSTMLIDRMVENQPESLTGEDRGGFYFSPSRAGSCHRRLYYEVAQENGEEIINNEQANLRHIFEDGRLHEDTTIRWFEASGIRIEDRQKTVNIPIPDDITINRLPGSCNACGEDIPENHLHGHIDGTYKYREGRRNRKGLFEHKAVGRATFDEFRFNGISPYYLMQAGLYLKGLGLTRGKFIVKNKDNSHYLEADISYDPDTDTLTLIKQKDTMSMQEKEFNTTFLQITRTALEDMANAEEYLERGELPPRQPSNFCFACSYKEQCDGDFREREMRNLTDMGIEQLPEGTRDHIAGLIREFHKYRQIANENYSKANQLKAILMPFCNEAHIKGLILAGEDGKGIKLVHQAYFTGGGRKLDEEALREVLGDDLDYFYIEEEPQLVEKLWTKGVQIGIEAQTRTQTRGKRSKTARNKSR
jgi:hypothetical protein